MTETTETKPSPALLTSTIKLSAPVKDADGAPVAEVTVTELTLRQVTKVHRERQSDGERAIGMLAAVTGLPYDSAAKIRMRDASAITAWRTAITRSYAEPDGDPLSDGGQRSFDLVLPLKGGAIPTITLREPDIGCGVAIERFKTEAERDGALIATLSDLSIPIVEGLCERDVTRLKAWIGPFVTPASGPGAGTP